MSNLDLFSREVSFAVLGSGSRGNATVVVCDGTALLLDCGLSAKSIFKRLHAVGLDPTALAGIVLTHEHGDHVAGARVTSKRLGIPVFMTSGCRAQLKTGDIDDVRTLDIDATLRVGSLRLDAFRLPHDAVDTVGFVVGSDADRLGLVTDLGSVPRGLARRLRTCRAVVLEFNHDVRMVHASPYPTSLKARILGGHGHLSNAQAAALLTALDGGAVRDVVLAHLSETNNTPGLALGAARKALSGWSGKRPRIHLAAQDEPSEWVRLDTGRM